jgi:hypothetical protein
VVVRELTRFMLKASSVHLKSMYCAMKYMLGTSDHGKIFQPCGRYVEGFKFEISGRSDSDYAKCLMTPNSVMGYKVYVNKQQFQPSQKCNNMLRYQICVEMSPTLWC